MTDCFACGNTQMTNTEGEAQNIFDNMLSELYEQWASQNPFMLQNGVLPEDNIDPLLLSQSLDISNMVDASSLAPVSLTHQQEQVYPFGMDSSAIRPAEQVAVSTPIHQQENISAVLSDFSPNSAVLHTPTHRDRGHYGSARRRTGALTNFQSIAPSPENEAAYNFEPIPENQQGILSPSQYINEDIPEFRPRRVTPESEPRFPELLSPCLVADPNPLEGAAGGFDSQGTELGTAQEIAQLQNAVSHLSLSEQWVVSKRIVN